MKLSPAAECYFERLGVYRQSWRIHVRWAGWEARELGAADQQRVDEAFAVLMHPVKREIYTHIRDGLSRCQTMSWVPARHWSIDLAVLGLRVVLYLSRAAWSAFLVAKERVVRW